MTGTISEEILGVFFVLVSGFYSTWEGKTLTDKNPSNNVSESSEVLLNNKFEKKQPTQGIKRPCIPDGTAQEGRASANLGP